MTNEYDSRYTDKKVSAAQHLAEMMCIRIADKDKRGLPYKFWNQPDWKTEFLNQLRAAQSLLKIYSVEAITKVLRNKPKVYSLRATWLNNDYQLEQTKIDQSIFLAKANAKIPNTPVCSGEARPTFSTKKNVLKGL